MLHACVHLTVWERMFLFLHSCASSGSSSHKSTIQLFPFYVLFTLVSHSTRDTLCRGAKSNKQTCGVCDQHPPSLQRSSHVNPPNDRHHKAIADCGSVSNVRECHEHFALSPRRNFLNQDETVIVMHDHERPKCNNLLGVS